MDSEFLHPLTAGPGTERPAILGAVPSTPMAHRFATHAAAAICLLVIVAATIGDFTLEVIFRANSVIGMRLSTDRFDHPDRICFAHTTNIGRVKIEASFGSVSPAVPVAIDCANVVKGGKSIPALTSPEYSPSIHFDITRIDRALWKSFSPKPIVHPPEMALSGGNSPGQCWAFAGHTGQLGIQLPSPVRVTSFTVEHTWNSSFIKSAPRNIVLWGLIPKDSKDVYSEPKSSPHTIRTTSYLDAQFGALHTGILLASVGFDPHPGWTRQTFPVHGCRESHRPFDYLVAQIVGNWGHPDFTCLYRLEINGEVIDDLAFVS